VLFAVAAGGDQVALSLVERQAAEICVMAAAAMRRVDVVPAGTPVVLGGGVLEARDPRLLAAVHRQLAEAAPGAIACVLDVPPIVGAALLGLDHRGAGAAACRRLRNSYRLSTA
jgi:hypothetical protein